MTSNLLMFITGSKILDDKLKVEFNADPKKVLLEAEAFKKACITSLSWGAQGYGRF